MKFSVIIPLYNKEKYILNTLNSVFNQSYEDFEVIVVNDSSTDNSLNLVSTIKDKRLRVYTIPNGGVSVARNFGIKEANGEYIAFLDGDDIWKNNHLQVISNMINTYENCGLYFTSYDYLYASGISESKNFLFEDTTLHVFDNYCEMVMANNGYTPCWTGVVVVKKNILEDMNGFPIGIKAGEDLDLWLRIGLKYPTCYSAENTASYLQDTDNNSQYGQTLNNVFNYKKWYNYDVGNKLLNKYTTNMLITHSMYLLRSKKFNEASIVILRCKGYYKFIKRLCYLFLSLFHIRLCR